MQAAHSLAPILSERHSAHLIIDIPLRRWLSQGVLAVGGSLAYGASLGLAIHHGRVLQTAVWVMLSAGLSWLVFIPALALAARRSFFLCLDRCLLAMAWGEVVLLAGAGVNLLLGYTHLMSPVPFNIVCVAVSNIVMTSVISRRMSSLGIPLLKTIFLWLVALNGSGALSFYLFRSLVETRP